MAMIMHAEKHTRNVFKALIAAEYVGVEIKYFENFRMGVSNKSAEFLDMNPLGHYPVLETPDGPIFESNAMARYVAYKSFLFGYSRKEYGQIEQWIDFSSHYLDANIRRLVLTRMRCGPYNESAEESLIASVKRGLGTLNTHLGTLNTDGAPRAFLVANRVTLADIITTCSLLLGFQKLMPKSFTSKYYPHVERYFWRMIRLPKFRKFIRVFKQLEGTVAFPTPTKPPKAAAEDNGAEDENNGAEEDNGGAEEEDNGGAEDENNGADNENNGAEDENNGAEEEDNGAEEDNRGAEEEDNGADEDNGAAEHPAKKRRL
ncbi:elongation factor 1-gamma 2-like isoform X2 [Rutidosis leptorrhynchoides]|uniref:elongation factor 1-gamma 2-like isoform X2 n=1 Tax=Rutidosis leptorrhynchoides TaxID=125765 RepID=UPI003A999A02